MRLCDGCFEFRGKRAFARWVGIKLTDTGNATVVKQFKNGMFIKLNLLTPEHQSLYYFNSFDDGAIAYLRDCLDTEGCVFLDIGASVGIYTMAVADVVKRNGGRIAAVEPFPENFSYLENSVRINNLDFVDMHCLALGERDGRIKLELSSRAPVGNVVGEFYSDESSAKGANIRMLKLDDHKDLLGLDRLDCIKIDIEGFDLLALKGMTNLISTFKPVIYAEFSQSHMSRLGLGNEDLSEWLRAVKYSAHEMNIDGAVGDELADIASRIGDVVILPSNGE